MSEKIIDEVMGLVDSYAAMQGVDTYNKQVDAHDAIRAKIREVLERKPLGDEEIAKATRCDIDDPIFMIAKGFVQAGERAHNIGAE